MAREDLLGGTQRQTKPGESQDHGQRHEPGDAHRAQGGYTHDRILLGMVALVVGRIPATDPECHASTLPELGPTHRRPKKLQNPRSATTTGRIPIARLLPDRQAVETTLECPVQEMLPAHGELQRQRSKHQVPRVHRQLVHAKELVESARPD